MKCGYCHTEYNDNRGRCVNCGAPKSAMVPAQEREELIIAYDIYQEPYYMDAGGNFVRMLRREDITDILIRNRDAIGLARYLRTESAAGLQLSADNETRKIVIEDAEKFLSSVFTTKRDDQ